MAARRPRSMLMTVVVLCAIVISLLAHSSPESSAQGVPIRSSSVWGFLRNQYSSHELVLQPFRLDQPLRIELEYVPQGRWELDDRFNFYVLDEVGVAAVAGGQQPGSVAVAAGDPLPGFPRRLQAIILQPRATFQLRVYNDAPVPVAYQVTVENGEVIDETGGQVRDRWNPAPGIPFAPVEDGSVPDGVLAPLLVIPAPTPSPTATPTPEPPVTGASLRGRLSQRYASDYYRVSVVDRQRPLQVEMVYDPEDQLKPGDGLNFYLFTDGQIRTQTESEPWLATNTAAGQRSVDSGVLRWRATIVNPFDHYILAVSQTLYPLSVGYRLEVENGILVDESREAVVVLPTPTPRPTLYFVEAGDTLATLATRFYAEPRLHAALCRYNRLPRCDRIEIGAPIRLPQEEILRLLAGPLPTPTRPAVIWGCSKC